MWKLSLIHILFDRAGVSTIEELISYYPRTYERYEKPVAIASLREGDFASILGRLEGPLETRYLRGLSISSAVFGDGIEHIDVYKRQLEETGVRASIIKYVGKSQYTFNVPEDTVSKDVHWYLMMADSYYSKPQREEYFVDSGYYKFHEAYHLLKFSNEKMILEKAYNEYLNLKKNNLWGNRKYF